MKVDRERHGERKAVAAAAAAAGARSRVRARTLGVLFNMFGTSDEGVW